MWPIKGKQLFNVKEGVMFYNFYFKNSSSIVSAMITNLKKR